MCRETCLGLWLGKCSMEHETELKLLVRPCESDLHMGEISHRGGEMWHVLVLAGFPLDCGDRLHVQTMCPWGQAQVEPIRDPGRGPCTTVLAEKPGRWIWSLAEYPTIQPLQEQVSLPVSWVEL